MNKRRQYRPNEHETGLNIWPTSCHKHVCPQRPSATDTRLRWPASRLAVHRANSQTQVYPMSTRRNRTSTVTVCLDVSGVVIQTRFIFAESAILVQKRRFSAKGKRYSIPPAQHSIVGIISLIRTQRSPQTARHIQGPAGWVTPPAFEHLLEDAASQISYMGLRIPHCQVGPLALWQALGRL